MTGSKLRSRANSRCAFCIRNEFADLAWRAIIVASDITTHAAVAGVMLLSIWGLERTIHYLWSGGEPTLFKGMGVFEIHLAWLFNATDVALIAVFSLKSVTMFWDLYRHRSDPI
jgi:hypothetical protein